MAAASQPAFLAIDLGSTDLKVGVVAADDGSLLALERTPVPVDRPDRWWSALCDLVPLALGASGSAVSIEAICVDGHGPTCVPASADGGAAGPAVPWSDGRASEEAAALAEATGAGSWALSILPAAAWLERHDRAVAEQTRWYLNSWEWVSFRLSGVAARTRSAGQELVDASAPGVAAIVPPDKVPPTVDAGTVLGALTAAAAVDIDARVGIPVVAGLNDAFASCLGIGLLDPGDAYDAGGSAGGFAVYTDRPVHVPGAFSGAAPVPDRWFVGGVMNATGRALDWLAAATRTPASVLLEEAATVPAGAGGVVFLPYLSGERSPLWDPRARAAFVGLTLDHGRPHLARAVLESAALAIRHVATPIVAAGVRVTEMRVAGRPAESDTWNRIKADVTSFRVGVPAVPAAALVGGAVLSAVATGRRRDVESAIRGMVRIVDRIEPDPVAVATYDRVFETYCDLSARIASSSHALADIGDADSGHSVRPSAGLASVARDS